MTPFQTAALMRQVRHYVEQGINARKAINDADRAQAFLKEREAHLAAMLRMLRECHAEERAG